jgi:hypothetical protein
MTFRTSMWSSLLAAVVIAVALGLVACGASDPEPTDTTTPQKTTCTEGPERNGPYNRVIVIGETSAQGIIDPSVEYAATESIGLMAYTAVPSVERVHISMAESDDKGASWHYLGDVTTAYSITITTTDKSVCDASSCDGTLVHESPSLVVDPFDPDPNRRLKVFAHAYFFGRERQFQIGYLGLYTAGGSAGPWTETKLFGWPSSSPLSTAQVEHDIASDPTLPQLRDCVIVGEPAALVRASGTIDLGLSCAGMKTDIRLLRSQDHGATWNSVGTLLTFEDARKLGASLDEITGGDLFYANDAYHLIATPVGLVDFPHGREKGYRGCVVVSIADLDAALVARCDGAPVVEARYLGQPGQFVGACSTDAGATAAGMLIPMPDLTSAVPFQLFASGLSIP